MITINPMMPQRENAPRALHPRPPMRGVLAAAYICAAIACAGFGYSAALYAQETRERAVEVSTR